MIRTTLQGVPTATSMVLTYELIEKLTKPYCSQTSEPIVAVNWSVGDSQLVGAILYARIQAVISVTYKPKCSGNMITNTFVESELVSFAGATATSAVAVVNTDGYTDPAYICSGNCNHAQGIKHTGIATVTMS